MGTNEETVKTTHPATITPAEVPEEMDLVVVNINSVAFEGKVKSLIAPGPLGNFAILPGHTPLFTQLTKGKLVIVTKDNEKEIEIEGGIAKINQTKVVVLVGF